MEGGGGFICISQTSIRKEGALTRNVRNLQTFTLNILLSFSLSPKTDLSCRGTCDINERGKQESVLFCLIFTFKIFGIILLQ